MRLVLLLLFLFSSALHYGLNSDLDAQCSSYCESYLIITRNLHSEVSRSSLTFSGTGKSYFNVLL